MHTHREHRPPNQTHEHAEIRTHRECVKVRHCKQHSAPVCVNLDDVRHCMGANCHDRSQHVVIRTGPTIIYWQAGCIDELKYCCGHAFVCKYLPNVSVTGDNEERRPDRVEAYMEATSHIVELTHDWDGNCTSLIQLDCVAVGAPFLLTSRFT